MITFATETTISDAEFDRIYAESLVGRGKRLALELVARCNHCGTKKRRLYVMNMTFSLALTQTT